MTGDRARRSAVLNAAAKAKSRAKTTAADQAIRTVNEVCFGRTRVESQRWTAFRSHYGLEAFYCLPGKDGAHEKGGVENEGGRFRRTHMVPVPEVDSLDELNELLAAIDKAEDERIAERTTAPERVLFSAEAPLLRPLPEDDFDCGLTLTPTVSSSSRITVRQCYYSVPARFIGRKVRVSLRANHLIVFDGRREVARHPRLSQRYSYRDELDHYLEILLAKPGALAGSSALAIARAEATFTATHQSFWDAAMDTHGRAEGTRALVQVLLLHRHRPTEAVLAGIASALAAGSTSPELVAIEARKAVGCLGSPCSVDLSDLDLPEPRAGDTVGHLQPRGVGVLSVGRHPGPELSRSLPARPDTDTGRPVGSVNDTIGIPPPWLTNPATRRHDRHAH